MKCSKCGLENKPGTKFCESCGNKLKKGKVGVIISLITLIILVIIMTVIFVIKFVFKPNYKEYLSIIEKNAFNYLTLNDYDVNEINKTSNITISDLAKERLIPEEINDKCKGYVLVDKTEKYTAYLNCGSYITDGYDSKYEKKTRIYVKEEKINSINKIILKDEGFKENEYKKISKKLDSNYTIDITKFSDNSFDIKINNNKVEFSGLEEIYLSGKTIIFYGGEYGWKKLDFYDEKGVKVYSFDDDLFDSNDIETINSEENKLIITTSKISNTGSSIKLLKSCPKGDKCILYIEKDKTNSNTLDEIVKLASTPTYSARDRSYVSKDMAVIKEYTFVVENGKLSFNPQTKAIKTLEQFYNEKVSEGYSFELY